MQITDTAVIDLDDFRSPGVRVFAGRDRGTLVRRDAKLNQLDRTDDPVVVCVPDDTFSISSSFFLALFGESIRRHGAEGFLRKYLFVGADISETVNRGIQAALRY
jgi:hypothetical protein